MTKNFRWWFFIFMGWFWLVMYFLSKDTTLIAVSNLWFMGSMLVD